MAHHEPHAHGALSQEDVQDMGIVHEHPTFWTYIKVGTFLTLITIVEVWAYYIPAWVAHWSFVPALLIMSAVKFATVVLFYMHIRYDHRLFKALFTGPLIIACVTLVSLMFLFGHFSIGR
jgi:cytochrome c oxidase subunit 4